MLTNQQLAELQAFRDAGDPIAYYSYLKNAGVGYASLALGVASNANSDSVIADFGGLYALNYLKEKYRQFNGADITEAQVQTVKTRLMEADYAIRTEHSGEATAAQIAGYHYKVFDKLDIPESAWTGDTLHRRINDQFWCLTCGTEEIGPNAQNFLARFTQIASDFITKFSAEDWAVFASDALFGKVLVKTLFEYGSAHPDDAAIGIATASIIGVSLPQLTSAVIGTIALATIAPESWSLGLAVGTLLTIDPSLTVEMAKRLIDGAANSYSPGTETIACFNAIRAQLPTFCVAEFGSDDFASKALDFTRTLRSSGTRGVLISPLTTNASLAVMAESSAPVREMLLSGRPFSITWAGTEPPNATAEYNDYPPQFWLDRETWLRGVVADNEVESTFITGDTRYLDQSTGLTTTVGGDSQSSKNVIFEGTGYLGSSDVDVVYGGAQNDVLRGGAGTDTLYGGNGNDVLDGGSGADKLYGGSGDDWLGYTASNLDAGSANELDSEGNFYQGGQGNDYIFGSKAADTFWFQTGDAQDIIRGNGGADELWYAAEGAAPVISREGKNLIFTGQGQDRIVLQDWYGDDEASATRLNRLVLTNTSSQDQAPLALGVILGSTLHQQGLTKRGAGEARGDLDHYEETLIGSDGVDYLYSSQSYDGVHGGDLLIGGKGDDFLYGSIGADRLRVSAGDGKDVFRGQGGADIVEFNGLDINSPNVLVDRVMSDLRITFEDGTALTVKDWDAEGSLMSFRNGADGPLVSYSEMSSRVKRFFGDGSDNYYVVTTPTSQTVYGSGGNDTLVGSNADDLLDGGSGNDLLFGGAGNDQLWGQTGNDVLYGGADNDRLYGNGGQDTLWGEGGDDLLVGGDDDDGLNGGTGQDTLWGGLGNEVMDGGAGDDNLYGEAGNDTLRGGLGSNILAGGTGNDTFYASGSRDEMWGGGDFDTYHLTPTGLGTQKFIFEDAQGGQVDLSAYAQAGIGIHLLRNSADQLILNTSQGESIVVTGWSNQTTSLTIGSNTWGYAQVQDALSEKYGYTYQNIWQASQFDSVMAGLSPTFAKAVTHFGASAVQSVFADGLSNLVPTRLAHDGAQVYHWGWKAGTLSDEALSEGAKYEGSSSTLFEGQRTRSSPFIKLPQNLLDPHPVDRVDMWYDFWKDPANGWSFAVVDAYSADAASSTVNPDGSREASKEYNKIVNMHDPATWGLLHAARNDFQLLATP
jgi:Ca2+-binding RTX toxin-like protein